MAAGGWIKLHRSFLDWEWYKDSNTKSVFIHLLLTANVEDKIYHGHLVRRGEAITSYNSLSTSLALSEQQARTAVAHLKSTGEITSRIYPKWSLITIVNYEKYQEIIKAVNNFDNSEKQGNKQDNKQIPDNQQAEQQAINKQNTGKSTTPKEERRKNKEYIAAAALPQTDWESDSEIIKEAWNALGLQQITSINLNQERGKGLQRLFDEYGVDTVLQAIENVRQSNFLKGHGGRGWKITFDWFVVPDHFIRILEKNYNDEYGFEKTTSGKDSGQAAEARRASVAKSMNDFMNDTGAG